MSSARQRGGVSDDGDEPDGRDDPERRVVDGNRGEPADGDAPDGPVERDGPAGFDPTPDPPETHPSTDARAFAHAEDADNSEGVLDPDDLDISEREGVVERDDGQFVISTEGKAIDPDVPEVTVKRPGVTDDDGRTAPIDALASELADGPEEHRLAVVHADGDDTASIRLSSTDPEAVLEMFLQWYATETGFEVDASVLPDGE
jgi:hypothetical protein